MPYRIHKTALDVFCEPVGPATKLDGLHTTVGEARDAVELLVSKMDEHEYDIRQRAWFTREEIAPGMFEYFHYTAEEEPPDASQET